MNISYISINSHSKEQEAIAQWAGHLLPPTWTVPAENMNDAQRSQFLLGRILLFQRLAEIGYDFAAVPKMYYTSSGKPYFNEKLYFDIAYAEGVIIVATSQKQPMGIHVEAIRPIANRELQSYFSPREWLFISKKKITPTNIVKGWIIRAGLAKLLGKENTDLPFYKLKMKRSKLYFEDIGFSHSPLKIPKRYVGHIITRKPTKFTTVKNITPEMGSMLHIIRA